jgi:hypothetical protein
LTNFQEHQLGAGRVGASGRKEATGGSVEPLKKTIFSCQQNQSKLQAFFQEISDYVSEAQTRGFVL